MYVLSSWPPSNMPRAWVAQVTTTVLDDGTELESPLVIVGVGSKPRTELLQGQVELLDDKPGGVKARARPPPCPPCLTRPVGSAPSHTICIPTTAKPLPNITPFSARADRQPEGLVPSAVDWPSCKHPASWELWGVNV